MDATAQKFYAVRAGFKPGIYLTWPECQAQTSGFRGATYKSFPTRQEAELFVAGKDPNPGVKKADKFYAVAVGSKPGIYTDWAEAQLAYMGVKGPKYRKFETRAEAENYMRTFAKYGQAKFVVEGLEDEEQQEEEYGDEAPYFEVEEPAKKKTKTAPLTPAPTTSLDGGIINVYTDGSSLSNGRAGAAAGVGVYFGKGDPRNVSERLQGEPQTNQRAELTAILRALQAVGPASDLRIVSDSKYAISCVTEWYANWERNGWATRDGPVKNQDLVKAVRAAIGERDRRGARTLFQWVKGHAATAGNVAADQLAVLGAKKRS
ncbi:Ribonuclease H [Pleurostoma richardsiae]|uniref:Ribonuclease H n=1 Tax=Pleurostoma richardsiae TaxID=41990 RepID=A0AA38VMI2_9PEZI|nr:Ribonuclease H [Pleurostoma richardsiae]